MLQCFVRKDQLSSAEKKYCRTEKKQRAALAVLSRSPTEAHRRQRYCEPEKINFVLVIDEKSEADNRQDGDEERQEQTMNRARRRHAKTHAI